MSESTIPFQGQTAVLDRPQTEPGEPLDGPGGSNRSKLLALGGLAAVVVLGVVAYFLLFAGGSDPVAEESLPKRPAVVPADEGAEDVASGPAKQPRISSKSFGRDPFKALVTEPVASETVGGTSTGTPAGTGSTATGTISTGDTTTSTGSGSGTTTTTTEPAQSTAHRFKVVDVAPDNSRISVKVDGEFYRNLKAGEVFASFFKVRFIGGAVNDFQFGEETFKVVGTKAVSIG